MNDVPAAPRPTVASSTILVIAVVALVFATAALTAVIVGRSPISGRMMSLSGGTAPMIGGGVMGSRADTGRAGATNGAAPGDAGFVAGTAEAPRIIRILAGPGYAFSPSTVAIARGETVTFLVTTMGPTPHEFMVGPAVVVAADQAGTPEIADIALMQSGTITYTFDGSGPFAFACHAPGHYESGMRGTITIVG